MSFSSLFSQKPILGCIHLAALLGAPQSTLSLEAIIERAIHEAHIYKQAGIDGFIVENFHDIPFFPQHVPNETVAAMAIICYELKRQINLPLGVNVLRNDACAALAIAAAAGAEFIRVNVHLGAVVADQGIIQGIAHELLRYRAFLKSQAFIMADVAVKHAMPLAAHGLSNETKDLSKRGMVDALIVSGSGTGAETRIDDLITVAENTHLPVFIGSGITRENIEQYLPYAEGFIVGSYFKSEGIGQNAVDPMRVKAFQAHYQTLLKRK
jgi:uncharacterized protein